MPTGGERLVWGFGDGSTLGVVETPFGLVGTLICWENYMPLARAAMYAPGVDIYLAPDLGQQRRVGCTMRHIAKEGRVFVVAVNHCLRGADVPADLPGRDETLRRRRRLDVTGQHHDRGARRRRPGRAAEGEEGILYADLDASRPGPPGLSSTRSGTTAVPTSSA